jgi:hypothetical protein
MEKYSFVIPAGGKVDVNASGNRIYCEAATAPFNLKSGSRTFELKAKRTYVLKAGMNKFLLENTSGAPNSVEVHIGDDEIIDNEVLITGTISGDVKIINSDTVGKEVIRVDDDESQARLAEIKDKLSFVEGHTNFTKQLLQNTGLGRAKGRALFTSLTGASYAFLNNATTTIVSAGANVNGVIIHHVDLTSESATAAVEVLVNGNVLLRTVGGSAGLQSKTQRDIIIPAGWPIDVTAAIAGRCSIWYEVL